MVEISPPKVLVLLVVRVGDGLGQACLHPPADTSTARARPPRAAAAPAGSARSKSRAVRKFGRGSRFKLRVEGRPWGERGWARWRGGMTQIPAAPGCRAKPARELGARVSEQWPRRAGSDFELRLAARRQRRAKLETSGSEPPGRGAGGRRGGLAPHPARVSRALARARCRRVRVSCRVPGAA
jgi:hypothetical protein